MVLWTLWGCQILILIGQHIVCVSKLSICPHKISNLAPLLSHLHPQWDLDILYKYTHQFLIFVLTLFYRSRWERLFYTRNNFWSITTRFRRVCIHDDMWPTGDEGPRRSDTSVVCRSISTDNMSSNVAIREEDTKSKIKQHSSKKNKSG